VKKKAFCLKNKEKEKERKKNGIWNHAGNETREARVVQGRVRRFRRKVPEKASGRGPKFRNKFSQKLA